MSAGYRPGLVAKDLDERVADSHSLLLGLGHAVQGGKEPIGRIDNPQLGIRS
jgi:hypothetical protein